MAKASINEKRTEILCAMAPRGESERGLFSLTVPTGGGKTISSMVFALRHALYNGMSKVIYVIPYVSIIEQTKEIFENIFGAENVVAHYASVDYKAEKGIDKEELQTDKRLLATEDWDASLILTTSVQFFESLYSNRSSRCRKLHNIVNSVIIFDEAQMLPVPYLKPCVAGISQLLKNYKCSAVLCTATQPALNGIFEKKLPNHPVRELCPEPKDMYEFFRRIQYEQVGLISDDELTKLLVAEEQVLCIVNNRRQAQRLFDSLNKEGRYHLSTTMCPVHRRHVLEEIKKRLREGKPCRVISTSLVEAGVDVDFPRVYRAMAGLDSIIQAGGRCNREWKRDREDSKLYIFETEEKAPSILDQNIAVAREVLRTHDDIASPEAIDMYFNMLFYKIKDEQALDEKKIMEDIENGNLAFESISNRFVMIENSESHVYIPMGGGQALVDKLRREGPKRELLRELSQYSVGVYPNHFREMERSRSIEAVSENTGILCDMGMYSEETGLSFSESEKNGYMVE